jgi:diguanylate cyclase (GGDEF)-like protein/PAS domain S-box-containing protein
MNFPLIDSEKIYWLITENIPDTVWISDCEGNFVFISNNVKNICGHTPDEFYGKGFALWHERIHPDDVEKVQNVHKSLFSPSGELKGFTIDYRVKRKEGGWLWLNDRAAATFESNGKRYATGMFSNVNERKQLEKSLRENKLQLQSILDNTTAMIYVKDADGRYLFVNRQLEKNLHLSGEHILGKTDIDLGINELSRTFYTNDLKVIETKAPIEFEEVIQQEDGPHTYISLKFPIYHTADDSISAVCNISTDITERKRVDAQLGRLFAAVEHSINVVLITDIKGRIEYVNAMFEEVTGYSKEEAIGKNPSILASGKTTHGEYEELWDTIKRGKTWRGIFKNKKKNGQLYWGNGLITPIRDENGAITHFLAIQEDVSEKVKAEERVKYLTVYDELTNLCNRTSFMGQMNHWLVDKAKHTRTAVLLFIDIDGFRLINDTYGHGTGDIVLQRIAEIIRYTSSSREKRCTHSDEDKPLVGRLGGNEFAVFLPACNENDGMEVAEGIRKMLEKHRFVEISSHLTASIGMALFPKDGGTVKELVTKADASLSYAKELGGNRIHTYHGEDLVLEKIHTRMEWKGKIQEAIREDRLVPWFQPILDLKDNQIHHFESLARMRSTNGEIIYPCSFIDTAEVFALITDIDRIIIKKVILNLLDLGKGGKSFVHSINLSILDLEDKKFLQFLRTEISRNSIDPKCLIFEITETAAVRNLDMAVNFITELREMGCRLSLDDFGAGFTSFRYLKEMEVDYIKIDGSFIRKLAENKHDRLFVKAIADVAKGMGIKTVAEFVENKETVEIIREYGIDYAQGYYIGKPSPVV